MVIWGPMISASGEGGCWPSPDTCGLAERHAAAPSLSSRDPRHQAVLGSQVGDEETYQWGGRVRKIRLDRIEPGTWRSSAAAVPRASDRRSDRWSQVAEEGGEASLGAGGGRPPSPLRHEGRTRGPHWSFGSSAAPAIRLWNSLSTRCATASSSSSSVQPISRASSWRWSGGWPLASRAPCRYSSSAASLGSLELKLRALETSSRPEAGAARRLGVLGDAVGVVAVLGDREGDPLARRPRQDAAAKLRAHPRVGAQNGRRAGEHADELRNRATRRLDRFDQGSALVRCRQLVVDLEPADICFNCHLASASGSAGGNSALQSL